MKFRMRWSNNDLTLYLIAAIQVNLLIESLKTAHGLAYSQWSWEAFHKNSLPAWKSLWISCCGGFKAWFLTRNTNGPFLITYSIGCQTPLTMLLNVDYYSYKYPHNFFED